MRRLEQHPIERLRHAGVAVSVNTDDPALLADLVNPLVITEVGTLNPIAYDFHRRYDIASVHWPSAETLQHYKRERLPALQTLIGGALAGCKGGAAWSTGSTTVRA